MTRLYQWCIIVDMSNTERMQSALEAIASMTTDETTDHAQLVALMQAIARVTLQEEE